MLINFSIGALKASTETAILSLKNSTESKNGFFSEKSDAIAEITNLVTTTLADFLLIQSTKKSIIQFYNRNNFISIMDEESPYNIEEISTAFFFAKTSIIILKPLFKRNKNMKDVKMLEEINRKLNSFLPVIAAVNTVVCASLEKKWDKAGGYLLTFAVSYLKDDPLAPVETRKFCQNFFKMLSISSIFYLQKYSPDSIIKAL